MAKEPPRRKREPEPKSKKPASKAAAKQTEAVKLEVAPIATIVRRILAARPPGPQAAAAKPLPAGAVGDPVPINLQSLQQLITAIASQGNQGQIVWTRDSSELTVITGKISVALADGLIMVSIPVSCDQVASGTIQVPFASGSKDQPAGMVCATEERPRGPEAIVDVWGESLIAFAWRLILTAATRVAAQSGVDEDGAGLTPIAFTVAKDGLTLLPIARHAFDRVQL